MISLEEAKYFYSKIPKTIKENIEFRAKLHDELAKSKADQEDFLDMCRVYLPIFFATIAWTLNPQEEAGARNVPFIPRPKQIKVIEELDKAIKNQKYNFGIDKTRKQGATEIVTKVFSAHVILYEYSNFIVGSRVKTLVDNTGDFYTIFAKIDHVFNNLPLWFGDINKIIERKDMSLKYLPTNSTINGETTNESFKAGSRSTALFLDEFGRVDKKVAEAIDGSIHDVCNCVVYCSTHWLGPNHTFNSCIKNPRVHTETLYWYENVLPHEEIVGLWEVIEPGLIRIIDKEHYEKNYPSFDWDGEIKTNLIPDDFIYKILDDGEVQTLKSVVDVNIPNLDYKWRSLWHNFEWIDRTSKPGGKRDFYCNIAASPYGSSDTVFDHEILNEMKKFLIEPIYKGSLFYDGDFTEVEFDTASNKPNVFVYVDLINGRPNQYHNYVIGCDISFGRGSSNSVAEVYDVNTRELIIEVVDADLKPDEFAEYVIALCKWVGGVDEPYLIWESNGGQGDSFKDTVVNDFYYSNCYMQRREDTKTRKKTDKYGWRSNTQTKEWLFSSLDAAII
ncbi:MAG: hypothetical protein ACFFDN_24435 [Candidatus Hodarchaeota archaeon]